MNFLNSLFRSYKYAFRDIYLSWRVRRLAEIYDSTERQLSYSMYVCPLPLTELVLKRKKHKKIILDIVDEIRI